MQIARHEENILLIFHKDEQACDVEVFIDSVRLKSFTQTQLLERQNIGRFYIFRSHSIKGMSDGACITITRRGTTQVLASAKLTQTPSEDTAALSSNHYVNIYTVTFFDYEGKKLYNGGAERYLIDLADVLKKMGWIPRIVQAAHGSWTRMYFDLEVIGINWSEEGMLGLSRNFGHSPRAACHIYSPFTIAAAHASSPSIGISHGVYWDNGSNTIENTATKLEVLSGILHCSAVVSVDANTINAVQSVRPDLATKLIYIPNYVDIGKEEVRHKEHGQLTVLYPRRLYAPRGFDLSIEAAIVILKKHRHVRFLFVGDVLSPEADELQNLIRKFPGRVEHITLPFENMSQAYLRADIAIIPTKHSEGTSLSCLEAMQFGLAIVSTFVGGLSNLVLDEFNGLLIPPTSEALIGAIDRLVSDVDLRRRLGGNAHEVAKCFSKAKWQNAWAKLLHKTFGVVGAKKIVVKEEKGILSKSSQISSDVPRRVLIVSSDADLLPTKAMKTVIEGTAKTWSKMTSAYAIDVVTDGFENGAELQKYPRDAELYQTYAAALSYNAKIASSKDLLKLTCASPFVHGDVVLAILDHSKISPDMGQRVIAVFALLAARRAIYEILSANVGLDSPIHLGLELEKRRNRHVRYIIGTEKSHKSAHTADTMPLYIVSTTAVSGQFATHIEPHVTVLDALAIIRSVDSIEVNHEPSSRSDQLIFLLACILHPGKILLSDIFIKKTTYPFINTLRLKPALKQHYFFLDQGGRPIQYCQHQIIKSLFTKALGRYWTTDLGLRDGALDAQIFPASEGLVSSNERTVMAMFQACRVDSGIMEFVVMLAATCTEGLKSIDIKFQALNDVQQSPKLCQLLVYLSGDILSNTEFALRRDHVFSIALEKSLIGTVELMLCLRIKDSRHNFENNFGISVTVDRLEVV